MIMAEQVRWAEFETAAREIARAGRRLLEDSAGVPGVAFLATVGADGRPRMHPFIPAVCDGRLWAFVIRSPKQRDLDRDGWYGIHSTLGTDDESFFVGGRAFLTANDEKRSVIAERMPYIDIDERHLLYEFLIDRAMWTTWSTPTTPVYRYWKLTPPRSRGAR